MRKTTHGKMDRKRGGKPHSKPLLKSIHRRFSNETKDETGSFSDGVTASLGSPVSLGRRISDMTWEKARALAVREKHLWR